MSRLRIGIKPGVGPAVKVMANDTDDPWTTPNTDAHKFRFNSEIEGLGYIVETVTAEIDFTPFPSLPNSSPWNHLFWPTGSYESCIVHLMMRRASGDQYAWVAWPMVANIFPDWETRFIFARAAISDWRTRWHRASNPVQVFISPEARILRVTKFSSTETSGGAVPDEEDVPSAVIPGVDYNSGSYIGDPEPGRPTTLPAINFFATDLPTNEAEYPPAAPAPTPNQQVLRISRTSVRMARPGYDINDADENMIFSSERIPMKVAAAGTLTLSVGQTVVVTPSVPIDENCLVDFYGAEAGGTMFIPPFQVMKGTDLISYRIVNGTVEFRNDANVAVDIVYVVFSDGTTPQSTGTAKVLERLPDGHHIIRKPGTAGTSPRDVILDTRSSFLPIVAQGYVPYQDFVASDRGIYGTHMTVVNFANSGFKPFPLVCLKCRRIQSPNDIEYRHFRAVWLEETSPNMLGAQSVVCEVTDTQLKVYAWRGANATLVETDPLNFVYDTHETIGVRYFVFAIPTTL